MMQANPDTLSNLRQILYKFSITKTSHKIRYEFKIMTKEKHIYIQYKIHAVKFSAIKANEAIGCHWANSGWNFSTWLGSMVSQTRLKESRLLAYCRPRELALTLSCTHNVYETTVWTAICKYESLSCKRTTVLRSCINN
jgi:hypothetical protein